MTQMTAQDFAIGTVCSQITKDSVWGQPMVVIGVDTESGVCLMIPVKNLIDVETVQKLFANEDPVQMKMNKEKQCLEFTMNEVTIQSTNDIVNSLTPFATNQEKFSLKSHEYHENDELNDENKFTKFVRERSIFNWRKEGFLQVLKVIVPLEGVRGTGPLYFTPDHNPAWIAHAKNLGLNLDN